MQQQHGPLCSLFNNDALHAANRRSMQLAPAAADRGSPSCSSQQLHPWEVLHPSTLDPRAAAWVSIAACCRTRAAVGLPAAGGAAATGSTGGR